MVHYELADKSVSDMVERVINSFPGKFIHVNPADVHYVYKSSEKSKWRAQVRLVGRELSTVTDKKIIFTVHKEDWLSIPESMKAAIVFHELTHIAYDDKVTKYRLVQHDIQDFRDIVKAFGVDYENAEAVLKPQLK